MNIKSLFPAPLRRAIFKVDHVERNETAEAVPDRSTVKSAVKVIEREVPVAAGGGAGSVRTKKQTDERELSKTIVLKSGVRLQTNSPASKLTIDYPDGSSVKLKRAFVRLAPDGSLEISNDKLRQHINPDGSYYLEPSEMLKKTRYAAYDELYSSPITDYVIQHFGVAQNGTVDYSEVHYGVSSPAKAVVASETSDGAIETTSQRFVPFVSRRYLVTPNTDCPT